MLMQRLAHICWNGFGAVVQCCSSIKVPAQVVVGSVPWGFSPVSLLETRVCCRCSQPEFISSDFGAALTLLEGCNGSVKWHFANTPARMSNVDMQDKWAGCWCLTCPCTGLLDGKVISATVLQPGLFVSSGKKRFPSQTLKRGAWFPHPIPTSCSFSPIFPCEECWLEGCSRRTILCDAGVSSSTARTYIT